MNELSDSQQWVLLGICMIVFAVLCMAVAVWICDWIAGIIHRRKMRRRRFRW